MKKALFAGAAMIGLAVAPAHADEAYDTQPYTLSAIVVSGSVAGENIGGTSFAAPGLIPLTVTANDASGTAVGLTVGQDLAGTVPGNIDPAEGDSYASGCGSVDLTTSAVDFDPSKEITVFVATVDPGCAGGIGTTGTVDLFVAQ